LKYLVLGGSGFIGKHIVSKLLNDGHKVIGYSREIGELPLNNNLDWVCGDYTKETSFNKLLDGVDCVFHCISSLVPATDELEVKKEFTNNILPMIELLQAMRDSSVNKLVFLSSGGTVYGDHGDIAVKENAVLKPMSTYGLLKLNLEELILYESRRHSLKPLIIRASNPYGPGQSPDLNQGVISKFLKSIRDENLITIYGDGSVVRDYIYVTDVASACIIAQSKEVSGVYNIGSGVGYSLNHLITLLEKQSQKKANINFMKSRSLDVRYSVLDCQKANSDFQWRYDTDIVAGIKQTWDWLNK
jgi:UDP-glucose 4-epimerase